MNDENLSDLTILLKQANEAKEIVSTSSLEQKNHALKAAAESINDSRETLKSANDIDMEEASKKDLLDSFIDRLKLNDQRKVEDISFEGSGCAISMASASIMTDLIKGKSDNEAKEIIEDFLGMIKEGPELKNKVLNEDDKTKLMCLSGVKQYPMRVKCATLSWHTLISAMENEGKEISTEE